jgi:hypothetical protein
MPSRMSPAGNSTQRNSAGDALGGGGVGLPRQAQMPLTSREKLTAAFEAEWIKLAHQARADIVATYGSAKVVAEMYEYDETQLSRVLDGKANPPGWLLALVIWRCKTRYFVTAACDLACGIYTAKPPPTEEEDSLAIVRALRERGMESVARGWAGLPVEAP